MMINYFNSLLAAFKIKATCVNYEKIDNYFFYDLKLLHNARVRDIQKYSDEISLALKTPRKPSIRILHNEGIVRLEFVSPRTSKLNLFDFFTDQDIPKGEINCLLGQTVDGKKVWMDLAQNPHMIIAGTTGSGKSTLLHNIIANLFNYSEVELFLVDPKRIEFSAYKTQNVFNSYDQTINLIKSIIEIMDFRYDIVRCGQKVNDLKPIVLVNYLNLKVWGF